MRVLGMYMGRDLRMFKSFSLDLNRSGITLIRGLNLNSELDGRNNGSGKSLLMSGLAEILINGNPAIEGSDATARKNLFPFKTSQLTLQIDNDIIVKGRFGGVSLAYGLQTDSGAIEKVKNDVAKQYLVGSLGYNESTFYSIVYLDGGRDSPLISGTATTRLHVLSELLVSDQDYWHYYRSFEGLLKELTQKSSTLKQRQELLKKLEGESAPCTAEEVEAMRKELTKVKARMSECSSAIHTHNTAAALAKARKDLEDFLDKEEHSQYVADYLSKVSVAILRELKREVYEEARVVSEIAKLRKSAKEYKDTYAQLGAKLVVMPSVELPNFKELIAAYESDSGAAQHVSVLDRIESLLNKTMHSLCGLEGSVSTIHSPAELEQVLRLAQTLSDSLTEGSVTAGAFPFYPLSADIISKAKSKLNWVIDKCEYILGSNPPEDMRVVCEVDEETYNAALECQQIYLRRKSISSKKAAAKTSYDWARTEIAKLEATLHGYPAGLQSFLEDYTTKWSLCRTLAKDSGTDVGDADIDSLMEELTELEASASKLRDDIANNSAKLDQWEKQQTLCEELRAEVEVDTKQVRAISVVANLKEAFSNKGIKTVVMDNIAHKLSSIMNANNHLVCPEPMNFRFHIDGSKCDIMAIRNPGTNNVQESDVRFLSRGERKSFCLLFMYAMQSIIPDRKRLNVVVMDEMAANMDPITKELVFNSFLPALQEIVPHVIVVDTGLTDVPDAICYTVVKDGNESKLMLTEEI